MAYENKTFESIKEDILSKINGIDVREGSFTNVLVSPQAYELYNVYQELDTIIGTMFLEYAEGEFLDLRGNEYGVYRKAGTLSTVDVIFKGQDGVIIPANTLLINKYMNFNTDEEVTIINGSAKVQATAVDVGENGNVEENSLECSIPNIEITNTSGIGGTDIEKDSDFKERIYDRIRNPAASGSKTDYEKWAKSINGVGKSKCFPLGVDGNKKGKVDILILDSNGELPTDELINDVLNYINDIKPIGATVEVLKPVEKSINITAKILLEDKYSLEQAKNEYRESIEKYFKSISLTANNTVSLGKSFILAYDCKSIKNIEEFKLNGFDKTIQFAKNEIPVVGTIKFDEVNYET